jgi:hypothetical protein
MLKEFLYLAGGLKKIANPACLKYYQPIGQKEASMETETLLWNYLTSLARQLPTFLVYLGGVIWALVCIGKHTKASIFLIIGIIILFLDSVIISGIYIWLPSYLMAQGNYPYNMSTYYLIIGIINNLVVAIGFIFIFLAVFSGRSKPESINSQPPSPMNYH